MSNAAVHCKISFAGQLRRFAFIGTEFTSLKRQIADLFSIKDEFVLKYEDDEKEFVILDSPEEFRTALLVSPGLLRLVIDTSLHPKPMPVSLPAPPLSLPLTCHTAPVSVSPPLSAPLYSPVSSPLSSPVSSPHYFTPTGRRGGRGGRHQHRFNPQMVEMRRNQREMKLENIKKKIASFSDNANLTPVEEMRKQRLLQKLERITACMNGQCPRKEWKQQTRKNLSPETVQHIILLKQQIQKLQPELKQLKYDIREFSRCQEMGLADDSIKQEIIRMKERKVILKDQMIPLKLAIRSLKEGGSF